AGSAQSPPRRAEHPAIPDSRRPPASPRGSGSARRSAPVWASWWPWAGCWPVSVVAVQLLVEGDGGAVGQALHGAGQRVAAKQQIGAAGQIPRSRRSGGLPAVVEQGDLGAGGDVEAGLHRAAVAQRNADSGV